MSASDREMVETMMADHGFDIDTLPYTVPPGDEGLDISHAGGEYEAFEGLAHEVSGLSGWYVSFLRYPQFDIYTWVLATT